MPLWFHEFFITWSTCKILSTCTLDRFVWFLQHVGVGKGLAISWRLADLHLLGPPLVVALGLQCFLYAVITTIQVHVSLFLYFLWIHLPQGFQFQFVDTIFLFSFFFLLKEISIPLFLWLYCIYRPLFFFHFLRELKRYCTFIIL